MSVITSLTIQNTLGVRAISDSIPEFFKEQIAAIFEDIFPDSLKISMVLSSAIASNLAKGYVLTDAIKIAKEYLNKTLEMQLNLGKGNGPLAHML